MYRYVLTFKNSHGMRVLATNNDGRHTWATAKGANQALIDIKANNSADTLIQIFGEKPEFKIQLVECRSNHEAIRTVFEG